GMMPGMGQLKDAVNQVDDRDLDRTAAIIRGMTPAERENPKIINGSRRLRNANAAGHPGNDLHQVVHRLREAGQAEPDKRLADGRRDGPAGGAREAGKGKGQEGKEGPGPSPVRTWPDAAAPPRGLTGRLREPARAATARHRATGPLQAGSA